jgi:hypothetical protein
MATKRDNGGTRTNTATSATAANTATPEAMEQRLLAFAEQLGRVVGTVQAKAEGWMDRDALNKQVAGVRDSAAELLEQLSGTVSGITSAAAKTTNDLAEAVSRARSKAKTEATAASAAKSKGRSGGAVDAPGKKHRKPAPRDPRALAANAKRATMRANAPMAKTNRKRGRG